MADQRPDVFGGVDTHADTHHAAVVDPIGRHLGDAQFPTTSNSYRALLAWLRSFGTVLAVGVSGSAGRLGGSPAPTGASLRTRRDGWQASHHRDLQLSATTGTLKQPCHQALCFQRGYRYVGTAIHQKPHKTIKPPFGCQFYPFNEMKPSNQLAPPGGKS
uniref:IS110 family transposase n=1 Tax=Streptomyces europaeiscabiei TaxID=146819 RepID=UPI0038D407B9